MSEQIITTIITVLCSLFASSGFWAFVQYRAQKKDDKEDNMANMVRGLAHEHIVDIGREFIKRGYITLEEFNEFTKYLYEPYSKLGGNGLAKKIYDEVASLPIIIQDPEEIRRNDD